MTAEAKAAVVTGGCRGLGRELSLGFAAAGHRVVALYREDAGAAARLEADLADRGLAGRAFRCDVTREDADWKAWAGEVAGARQLVLVHNACPPFEPTPFHLLDWSSFEAQWQGAVKGAFLCTRELLRPLARAERGTVVNVLTAALSETPPKGFSAYVTAKGALQSLTRALAGELGPRGVRVFSVSPGFMAGGLTERWDPRWQQAMREGAGAEADPAELAARIVALVEDDAVPGAGEDHAL